MAPNERESALLVRVKKEVTRNLRESLAVLDDAAPVGGGAAVPQKEVLAVAHAVSREATKVGMLWSGDKVKAEDAARVLGELQQAVLVLITQLYGTTTGAGATLLKSIRQAAFLVIEASVALVEGAVDSSSKAQEQRTILVPPLAGRVWEACEGLKKVPVDNRAAVGRALAVVATSVKDVVREIGEMKLSEQEADQAGPEPSGSETDADVPSVEDELQPHELEVAQGARKVCEAVLEMLRQLLYAVAKWKDPGKSQEAGHRTVCDDSVTKLEEALSTMRFMSLQVDEIGASLYPPQELEEIKERTHRLKDRVGSLLALVRAVVDPPEALVIGGNKVERACDELNFVLTQRTKQ